jgi:hypothetical protein
VETGAGFRPGAPEVLFEGPYYAFFYRAWDLHPDGDRFVMLKPSPSDARQRELIVVENWFEELKRKVPVD